MSDIDASFYALTEQYPDESSAIRYFEERRWPHGATCPACSSQDVFRGKQPRRRRQVWHCRTCRKQFSVTSGTVMDSTKLPLRKWLFAFHLIGASKKGMSSLQLARMLRIDYNTSPKIEKVRPHHPFGAASDLDRLDHLKKLGSLTIAPMGAMVVHSISMFLRTIAKSGRRTIAPMGAMF